MFSDLLQAQKERGKSGSAAYRGVRICPKKEGEMKKSKRAA